MKRYWLSVLSLLSLAVLATAISLACGGSQQRILKSMSLTPATADAAGSSVQFSATGNFNQPPSPASIPANWGACYQNQATTAVSVSTDGLAQCAADATGTYTVWAWSENGSKNCGAVGAVPANPCGGAGQCTVTGTAQLTCP